MQALIKIKKKIEFFVIVWNLQKKGIEKRHAEQMARIHLEFKYNK